MRKCYRRHYLISVPSVPGDQMAVIERISKKVAKMYVTDAIL
jgi:hypothetical protein